MSARKDDAPSGSFSFAFSGPAQAVIVHGKGWLPSSMWTAKPSLRPALAQERAVAIHLGTVVKEIRHRAVLSRCSGDSSTLKLSPACNQ